VAYLSECFESILAQTFTNFEVVVCDDQSSDGTLELARKLANGDARFRFISNPDRLGLARNWNNCVERARGEWIKFVFQDDVIFPSCIEMLLAACEKHGKVFGFCEREFIFDDGAPETPSNWFIGHRQRLHCEYQARPVITQVEAIRAAVADPEYNMVGEPTVTLIRKSVFEEIGCFEDTLIQLCDTEFWSRVLITYGAAFVPERLAAFRLHRGAATAQNFETRIFRAAVLDPLVLRYRFAFGHEFLRLRTSPVARGKILWLRLDCISRAFHARTLVNRSEFSREDTLAEWKFVVSRYPGLQILRWLGPPIYLAHRLRSKMRGNAT
jgi:glycosyltransferase involved in cell wall biosynthesis